MSSLQELCRELEATVGKPLQTSRDFDSLSSMITERMRERISATTLKRLWGYLNEENNPRKYTLNLLSRFLGYRDFEHFSQQQGVVQSGFVDAAVLYADELHEGDKVLLCWAPNRRCELSYLGENKFVVESSLNSKLMVGDTFVCAQFFQKELLIVSQLMREGKLMGNYAMGKQGGVTWSEI